jgi:hypothetical protein
MRYGNDYNNHVGAYIKDMGYDAISIEYDGRNKELVVYNLNIISIVQ